MILSYVDWTARVARVNTSLSSLYDAARAGKADVKKITLLEKERARVVRLPHYNPAHQIECVKKVEPLSRVVKVETARPVKAIWIKMHGVH